MKAGFAGTPAWRREGRGARRLLVVLLALAWGAIASPVPVSLDGWGPILVAGCLGIFLILGHMTGWLSSPFRRDGDEIVLALRGLAYRRAFRLFLLGILLLVPMLVVGASQGGTTIAWGVPDPLGARAVAALLILLVVLPTAVMAWIGPSGHFAGGLPAKGAPVGAVTAGLSALVSVLIVAWLVGLQALPVSVASKVTIPDPQDAFSPGTCGAFAAVSQLDQGFGPSLVLLAQVCWNGRSVWLVNDPGGPSPNPSWRGFSNALPQFCLRSTDRSDFGVLADQQCRVWVDSSGSIHVVMWAEAGSGLPGMGTRWLQLNLVVARSGRVLSFD